MKLNICMICIKFDKKINKRPKTPTFWTFKKTLKLGLFKVPFFSNGAWYILVCILQSCALLLCHNLGTCKSANDRLCLNRIGHIQRQNPLHQFPRSKSIP